MNSDERFELFEESLRLINQGKMAEAEDVIKRLVEIEPENSTHWMSLGRCQLALNKIPEAEISARFFIYEFQGKGR